MNRTHIVVRQTASGGLEMLSDAQPEQMARNVARDLPGSHAVKFDEIGNTMTTTTQQTTVRPGRRNKTTISLEQFQAIENRVKAIDAAIQALESEVMGMVDKHDDTPTQLFLSAVLSKFGEYKGIEFSPYWWHPQPEWTGGDSMDPKNTVWNEPHIVNALLR